MVVPRAGDAASMGAGIFDAGQVRPRSLHPALAWVVVLFVFAVGYGIPTWGSVSSLLSTDQAGAAAAPSDHDRFIGIVLQLYLQIMIGALAAGAIWLVLQAGRRRGARLRVATVIARPGPGTWILVPVVMAIIATAFGLGMALAEGGVLGAFEPRSSTTDGSLTVAVLAAVHAVVAGPMEEIGVLLVPVVLLRASGHRWATVYITCIAMRLAFHLDYGLPVVAGLAIWATMMVTLYRATREIIALVVAHGLYNGLGTMGDLLWAYAGAEIGEALSDAALAARWGLVAVGIVISLVYVGRRRAAPASSTESSGGAEDTAAAPAAAHGAAPR